MPKFYKKDLLSAKHSQTKDTQSPPEPPDYDPIRTLLEWRAYSRPFRPRERSFFLAVAILLVLSVVPATFFGGIFLALALLALGFAVYIFNLIPPDEITYKLSTQGVTIGDNFYHWDELYSFWIEEKHGAKVLNIVTQLRFPAILILVFPSDKEEEIKKICAHYIRFQEIPRKSQIEKWAEGLHKLFPLENPSK